MTPPDARRAGRASDRTDYRRRLDAGGGSVASVAAAKVGKKRNR
jgi:hypothetical protein